MIKNYLKIAYRKLIRQKTFAAINIIGLAISLAVALLIFLYVQHELSYDAFHEKADRIYRTIRVGMNDESHYTPDPFASVMKQHVPGIEEAVRIWSHVDEAPILRTEKKAFNEDHIYIADSGFFSLFTTEMLVGHPVTALTQPRSLVLSEATAQKYFQTAGDAVGKSMYVTVFGEEHQYRVTAVAEDFPANSHFHFNALLSIDYSREEFQLWNWLADWPDTYFLLEEGVDAQQVQERMIALTDTLLNPVYEMRFGKSYESFKANGDIHEYHLQPLQDIRLYSAHMYDNNPQSDIRTVSMFATIGLLLLFIAVFNYVNLATAQSAQQAKSTGIRKVLGAVRSQLYGLFLTESVLICLIAALVGLTICQIVVTSNFSIVRQFLPTDISLTSVVIMLVLAGVIGLFSGWVPAQLLSSFQPTQVLKGQLVRGTKGSRLRNSLVIAQFAVSSGLIISIILISQQLSYLQNKSLGFNKEHLLVVKHIDKLDEKKHALKQMLSTTSYTANASLAYNVLGQPYNGDAFTPVEFVEQGQTEAVNIPRYSADRDYLAT
ncbi:MAG: ABC transporter permease, partial [Bacteroidota bacterium]